MDKVIEVLVEKIERLEYEIKCMRMENDELLSERVRLEQNNAGLKEEVNRLNNYIIDLEGK